MTFKDLLSNLGMIIAGFPVLTQACPLIQLLFYNAAAFACNDQRTENPSLH